MTDYVYAVVPAYEEFSSRHDAVGFKAIHERTHRYHPPADVRIEVHEGGDLEQELKEGQSLKSDNDE